MKKNILVIGGTRFFGKHLVKRLLTDGHKMSVATRGINPDDFGNTVRRIHVDRRNLPAMQAAFADDAYFDVIYDQMCYSPLDAAIAQDVFEGKVGRYIMTSTIETYQPLAGKLDRPFVEDDIDLKSELIDLNFPWHDRWLAEASYSAGKRQAEALLTQDGRLPVVTLRLAHVLSAKDDFTGRLAAYIAMVKHGSLFRYLEGAGVTSFLDVTAVTDFMAWTGQQSFLGPVNVACDGGLSALDLHQRICQLLDKLPPGRAVANSALAHHPFDYGHMYVMDTSRAYHLGYRFSNTEAWLDKLILELQANMLTTAGGG